MNSPVYSFDSAEQRGLSATNEKERSHVEPVTVEGLGLTAKLFVCLAGDLHFYMRHSFRPAPAPMKASGKVANGHVDDFSDSNPFAESAPSRLAAAKVLGASATPQCRAHLWLPARQTRQSWGVTSTGTLPASCTMVRGVVETC